MIPFDLIKLIQLSKMGSQFNNIMKNVYGKHFKILVNTCTRTFKYIKYGYGFILLAALNQNRRTTF